MATAIRASSLVLEPVIEVLPSTIDPGNEPPPGLLTPAQRQRRMQEALDRAGIGTLRVDGLWALARDVVDLPGACEVIVEATLRNRKPESRRNVASEMADASVREHWVDYVLRCGIAIRVDGIVRAWPGCCADWEALRELRQALDANASEERFIWIGHDGGALSISAADADMPTLRTCDDERGDPDEWLVTRAVLQHELEAAWDVVDRFEAVAIPILDARLGGRTLRSRQRS